MRDAIERALTEALGEPVQVERTRPVSGGCINEAARVDTSAGVYFAKWNDRPIPDQFEREAEGLRAMADSESALVVPRPLRATPRLLVMEWLEPGSRVADFDVQLGRGLAAMHRTTSAQGFGFAHDNYCGATPQPNGWMPEWLGFYGARRLGHQARLAAARGLGKRDLADLERLIERLDTWLGIEPEPPSLIHGDLWSGNLHADAAGRPALIDPAAYFGHREAELGMMVLFGGFSGRVFAAYDEVWPLQPGWRERLPLYTLYHVLNHFHLFGGGYGSQAMGIVRRFV